LPAAGASAFPPNGFFLAGGFPASVFAAVAFDRAAARGATAFELDDFNCFDGALCDAFGEALWGRLPASLSDLLAFIRRIFGGGVFADSID